MRFTFEQLRAFVVVAEEEHFGRAAVRLNLTQPPLSRQIQALERHLGVALFDRAGRRTRLTAAGGSFLVEARRLLELAAEAELSVRRVAAGESGVVNIGFTSVVGNMVLPHLLPIAAQRLPEVEIVLHELRTAEQAESLLTNRIDIALGRPFPLAPELHARALPPDGLVLAVPRATMEDRGGEPLGLRDLDGMDVVMYAAAGPRHVPDVVTSVLVAHDIHPRVVQRVVEVYTMLRFVDSGIGAAIVPASTQGWGGDATVFVELPELARAELQSIATWRAGASPATGRMLALLQHAAERMA